MTRKKRKQQQIRKQQEAELTHRLRNALTDIELFKEGKLKTRYINELLAELWYNK
jgi:hypothetical protein